MGNLRRTIQITFLVCTVIVPLAAQKAGKASVTHCRELFERQQDSAAEACFRGLLRQQPANVDANTYLGILADKAGNLQRAEKYFSTAVHLQPASAAALNNHGAVLLKMGKRTDASDEFERSLKIDPVQKAPLLNLAQIHFAAGDAPGLASARSLLRKAETLSPDADVARALVICDLKLNDKESAAADYAGYSETLNGTAASEDADARRDLGIALLAAGLQDAATTELSAAWSMKPSDALTAVRLARAYRAQKNIPAAGRTLETMVRDGQANGAVYAELADIYDTAGHPENAIPAMRLAIEQEPDNEAYLFRYGMLLTDSKAPEAGVIRLKEAVQRFPNSSRLWMGLGMAQFEDHKNADAEASFSRA